MTNAERYREHLQKMMVWCLERQEDDKDTYFKNAAHVFKMAVDAMPSYFSKEELGNESKRDSIQGEVGTQ